MPKFRKVVVPPGEHHHRTGVATITPERIKGWVNKFRAMKADGIRIPVPWGHQPKANPVEEDRIAEEEFYRSRYNATFVDDFELGPRGELVCVGEVPPGLTVDASGDLVDPATHTRIGEVSIAIRDWKDGKGRIWTDAPRHVALTPLPVAHGTGGFEALLSLEPDPLDLLLGTATLYNHFDLSTNTQKGKSMPQPPKQPPADAEPVDIMGNDPDAEGGDEADDKPIISFEDNAPGANGQDQVSELIPLLEEAGIHLTPDTTEANFLQHLKVALHAVKKREKPDEMMPDPNAAQPPQQPQEPVVEQTPPLMMSLATCTTPAERALFAHATRTAKAAVSRRLEALEKTTDPHSGMPFLKPARLEALRSQASGFELSLTPDGEPVETELDRTLSLLEELAPVQLSLHDADQETPPEKMEEAAVEEIVNKISSPGVRKAV